MSFVREKSSSGAHGSRAGGEPRDCVMMKAQRIVMALKDVSSEVTRSGRMYRWSTHLITERGERERANQVWTRLSSSLSEMNKRTFSIVQTKLVT